MLLQRTPLHKQHVARGAKIVEFGGWEMPLQFTKVLEEHHAVRKASGLFDISHMGILSAYSESDDQQAALNALNALVPQDLLRLVPGKAVYTQLLTSSGGIIDDIIVYWMPPTRHFSALSQFLVICNAANTRTVIRWIKEHLPSGVRLESMSATYALLALQGPTFQQVLSACELEPRDRLPKRFHIGEFQLMGQPVLLSRTGYTGEDGVEILVSAKNVEALWEALLDRGKAYGLLPVGLAARDTLRLEAAYPLHGAELGEEITPLEAGLGWSVKLEQETDFIGKAALLEQQKKGLTRHFVCFEVLRKSIPRHHDLIYDDKGNACGEVTSGSISPTLDKPVGVGYITAATPPEPGSLIRVGIRGNLVDALIVKRPFYQK